MNDGWDGAGGWREVLDSGEGRVGRFEPLCFWLGCLSEREVMGCPPWYDSGSEERRVGKECRL